MDNKTILIVDDVLLNLKVGFNGYLTKPIRKAQLHDCLTLAPGRKQNSEEITSKRLIIRQTISESHKRRFCLLLAEDNITNQQVAIAILEKLGYRSDVVANGKEALTALKSSDYNLVFMDCQMPGMDGYEATRQIRNPKSKIRNHEIPIIAMTAHAIKGDREKCLEAGMNDYITKPVSPDAMADVLERWLAKQGETGEGRENGKLSEQSGGLVWSEEEAGKLETGEASGGQVSPVFDRTAFVDRLMGDEDLAKTIITGFLEHMPKQMAGIKASIDRRDAKETGSQAHKIKDAVANVGGLAMSAVAFEMENAGKCGDPDRLLAMLPVLEKEFERLQQAMEKKN